MNPELRFVFDTNVIVSALLFNESTPGRALFRAMDQGELLVSPQLLVQLGEVLMREKFDVYLSREERERLLAGLVEDGTLIVPSCEIQACRDPSDDRVLELAVSGTAGCIVTGDKDLLVLNPFQSIAILTPAEFLRVLPAALRNSGE
jgi:putative PIN family toxin of toxin-antitoxin system